MSQRITGFGVGTRGEPSARLLFAAVLVVLLPFYFATAARSLPYNIDGFSNVLTAAAIGQTGSPVLEGNAALTSPDGFGVIAWVVESPRGPVSKYPPGAALTAAPLYALVGEGSTVSMGGTIDPSLPSVSVVVPPLWPAALAAAGASALVVAFLVLALRELVPWRWAVAAGVTLALGTGLWANAAHTLWQHGAAAMWVALGLLASSQRHWFGAGVSMGLGILTRPVVAIAAAGLGGTAGWRTRSWRPVALHGLGAALGLGALLAFNYWVWGEWTISGGYESAFAEGLVGNDVGWYLGNIVGGLVAPDHGLLVWSPVIAVAAIGLRWEWRELPSWAAGGLVGGVLLLLLQFRLNRYSGGLYAASYRYPIEAVVACTPALVVAARALWDRGGLWRRLLTYSAAWSVALHAGAVAARALGA